MHKPPYLFTFWLMWVCAVSGVSAQESVLYRISGNDIQTSFIFGVVHSTDPVTFMVSDSVYTALAECKQLAVEAIIDSQDLETYLAATYLEPGTRINSWLNNAKFSAIDQHIQRLTKQSLWKYADRYPLFLEQQFLLWQTAETGQTYTEFLRVLAEGQQLPVIGLYAPDELGALYVETPVRLQSDMLMAWVQSNKDPKQFQREMAMRYTAGKLQSLMRWYAARLHFEWYGTVLQWRTMLLEEKVSRYARRRATFFVVDAAMLGGDRGLLQVLRQQGLKVEGIGTGFTWLPGQQPELVEPERDTVDFEEQRTISYYELNEEFQNAYFEELIPGWYPLTSFRGAFTVRFPAEPEVILERIPSNTEPMTMHLYKFEDRVLEVFYIVSHFDYPQSFDPAQQPTLFRDMIARTVNRFNGILLVERDISNEQFQGREIEVRMDEDYNIRARFYLVGNRMYQVALGAVDRKAYSRQNEAFLRSFRILDQRSLSWFRLNLGCLQVAIPAVPERHLSTIKVEGKDAKQYTYRHPDPITGLQYAVSVTYLPEGFRLRKVNPAFHRMIYEAATQVRGVLIKQEDRSTKRIPGTYAELGGSDGSVTRLLMFYYDNRLIQLLLTGSEDAAFSAFADRFFTTFRFGEYEY